MAIYSFDDLRPYGITPLTGEACGLGMRVLCDLTPAGEKILTDFLGGNVSFKKGSNWNSGAVSSVMLPYSILKELGAFVLLTRYEYAITEAKIEKDRFAIDGVVGCDGERFEEYRKLCGDKLRFYRRAGTAAGGLRNEHVMSGRVV